MSVVVVFELDDAATAQALAVELVQMPSVVDTTCSAADGGVLSVEIDLTEPASFGEVVDAVAAVAPGAPRRFTPDVSRRLLDLVMDAEPADESLSDAEAGAGTSTRT